MTYQLAQEIVAHCGNCSKDLAHIITAIENDRVVSVLCGSCKEEHPFKSPARIKAAPKKRGKKKVLPKDPQQIADEWKSEMERVRHLSPTVYTMRGDYAEGEKLDHHAFGMGLIQKLIFPDKMEVLFEGGSRMLIRGNSHSF